MLIFPNGIKAIFFDLDGTLRHNRPEGSQAFWGFAEKLGHKFPQEARARALRWTHEYFANSQALEEDAKAYPDENEFWLNYGRRHLQVLGLEPELAQEVAPQINAYMQTEYEPEDWVPPEVPQLLKELRAAGFIVGIITNRTNPIDEMMPVWGFDGLVDFHYTAGEVGCYKPLPGFFDRALELTNLRPDQAIYVGDNYFADVVAAQGAGMHPVLLDPRRVFPEADCTVIDKIEQVKELLEQKALS
jgi:putative hydrolase of the HAD superfamily